MKETSYSNYADLYPYLKSLHVMPFQFQAVVLLSVLHGSTLNTYAQTQFQCLKPMWLN